MAVHGSPGSRMPPPPAYSGHAYDPRTQVLELFFRWEEGLLDGIVQGAIGGADVKGTILYMGQSQYRIRLHTAASGRIADLAERGPDAGVQPDVRLLVELVVPGLPRTLLFDLTA